MNGPREQVDAARDLLLDLARVEPYRHDARHGATLAALGLQVPVTE
jgi:hypothetical protein